MVVTDRYLNAVADPVTRVQGVSLIPPEAQEAYKIIADMDAAEKFKVNDQNLELVCKQLLNWVSLPLEMLRVEYKWSEKSRYHLLLPELEGEQGPRRQMEDVFADLERSCTSRCL